MLSRADARIGLKASKHVFEASRVAKFLRPHATDEQASVAGVERFGRCGARRHYEAGEALVPGGIRAFPLPPKADERRRPGTRTRVRTLLHGTLSRDDPGGSAGQLARFRSEPDRPFLPDPTGLPYAFGLLPSKPARRQGDR